VHRDISPPNILISRQGEVKLVDFGLAKATSQLENTEPGVVKGKFSYLSPEAAEGKEVDHRADIFATGILLFETITGRRLFYGDNDYETVQLVRQARIPSIAALNPDVEPALEEVIRKALAREVVDRFQHAADLQDALAQHLFSRGLKVTSRDIAHLVQDCLREKERSAPAKPKTSNIIDALISEEIIKFTSLGEEEGTGPEAPEGSRPLAPDEISAPEANASGDLIDPRAWGLDDLESGKAVAAPAAARGGQGGKPAPSGGRNGAQAAAAAKPPQAGSKKPSRPVAAAPPEPSRPAPPPRRTTAPRVATPVAAASAPAGDLALLEQMVESTAPGEAERRTPDQDQAPPPPRRWGVVIALVVLLLLTGVVVALAFKIGLIGGGSRPA
jgi:serine/threonine-protein kinase